MKKLVRAIALMLLAALLAIAFNAGLQLPIQRALAVDNPIVTENSLPGNPPSEWDISGAGSSNIQGFTTDISYNRGETVNFKIKTNSTNYRLDIYRMGYYGGNGARKVDTVQVVRSQAQNQPNCLTNSTTGLIDCGNWAVSASWNIPPSATSGIYFAKAVRQDGTSGSSHIVFIVRDDSSTSDILFQTSDTTWQAYNSYGGNSLYVGSPAGRAYKVSYNRPFNTRSVDSGVDWLFNAEYPMVRWLEANGYNVSYFTGVDSDRRGDLIKNHKLFLSVGHDEYWSKQQRQKVEAARDAGIHLAFFSGNEVFWKTRWENSIDGSGTPYRTLVCYKETHANAKIDPSPEWTGTWRDPRFSPPADGGNPENALTGTLFTVNAGATTSIQVPAADGKMRLWRNTSVANLSPGSTATFPYGTLGYEWDEDIDNGFRPAGSIRMSTITVPNAPVLIDYGSTFASRTATHHLTLYKYKGSVGNDALVFGSGTVQWSWGLDANHDNGSEAADVRMQQATVNLFADMGVQAATLQPGLVQTFVSGDTQAPTSTITSPTNGATVQTGTQVTISGTASDTGGGVVGGVEVSTDGGTTWHPANGRGTWSYTWLTPNTNGTITLKSRAADDSGNLETPGNGVTVTISNNDTTPPTVTSTTPNNGVTGVNINTSVLATFSEAMDTTTINTNTFELRSPNNSLVAATVTYDAASRTATLKPNSPLAISTTYTATVKGGTTDPRVKDLAGNALAQNRTWSFTTSATSSVSIWNNSPTPALITENDSLAVNLGVKFRSSVAGKLTGFRFYKGPQNTGTHVGVLWTSTGQELGRATFTNETASGWQEVSLATPITIAADTVYVASYHAPVGRYSQDVGYFANSGVNNPPLYALRNGESGANGVYSYGSTPAFPTSADQSTNYWVDVVFTPDTGNDTTPPTVTAIAPGNGATGISTGTAVTATFSEAMDAATINTNTFELRDPNNTLVAATVSYNTSTRTATLTPSSSLAVSTTYTAIVKGGTTDPRVKDLAGNALAANNTWSFTTTAPDTTPPTVTSTTPTSSATGVSISTTVRATFSEAMDAATININTFELRNQGTNALVTATVTYDVASRTATLTPSSPLTASTTYTATVKGGATDPRVKDLAGNALAQNYTWSFTTSATSSVSIWNNSPTPALITENDSSAVNLGVKFRSSVAGTVTGFRFYKGPQNTGTHVGVLWTSTGQELGRATFTNETASGWQEVSLATPITIAANTVYVASYHAPVGRYSQDVGYFANSGVNNPPLYALRNGESGANGVYTYSSTPAFPTSTYQSANYWVDVVFIPTP